MSTWPTTTNSSPFAPIADYGFLSDCETCALVAPNGAVEWLCLPRFDSPSVFGAILDRDAGIFRLGPDGVNYPAARRYLPGTMVLETSWWTRGGWIIVRDVLLIGPWHHEDERSHSHRRSPTDYDADHVLLRMIRCVNGEVQVNLDCEPKFDYGRRAGQWSYDGLGYHSAVVAAEGAAISAPTHDRHAPRLRRAESDRPNADEGRRRVVRRALVVGSRWSRRIAKRPTGGSSGRRTTGSTGSTMRSFRIIHGAGTCSEARSP